MTLAISSGLWLVRGGGASFGDRRLGSANLCRVRVHFVARYTLHGARLQEPPLTFASFKASCCGFSADPNRWICSGDFTRPCWWRLRLAPARSEARIPPAFVRGPGNRGRRIPCGQAAGPRKGHLVDTEREGRACPVYRGQVAGGGTVSEGNLYERLPSNNWRLSRNPANTARKIRALLRHEPALLRSARLRHGRPDRP